MTKKKSMDGDSVHFNSWVVIYNQTLNDISVKVKGHCKYVTVH